jgi:hypothetical protein
MTPLLFLAALALAEEWNVGDVIEFEYLSGWEHAQVSYKTADTEPVYTVGPFEDTKVNIEGTSGAFRILPEHLYNQAFPGFNTPETAPDYVHAEIVTFTVEMTGLSLFATSVVGSVEDEPCGGATPTYTAAWQSITDLTDLFTRQFSGTLVVPAGCRYKLTESANGSPAVTRWKKSRI